MGIFKNSRQSYLIYVNILKHENWTKKYMKINFSKVIFRNKSQVTFDELDRRVKGWILSTSNVFVAKRQQEGGSRMIRGWNC